MSLARNVATVGVATLLSRLLGFVRDVGIAFVLGAGPFSDAYFAALQIPNLFRRLLAEGAINSAFVPMWMRIRDTEGETGTRRFGEDVLGTIFAALAVAGVLCAVFAPQIVHLLAPGFTASGARFTSAVDFVRLSSAYIAVAGVVAIACAILNAEGKVAAAAFGLVVFNAIMVAAVIVVLWLQLPSKPAIGAALSFAIVIAGIGQLVLVGGAIMRLAARPRRVSVWSSPHVSRFLSQAIPGVIAGGIPQLKLMAGAMVASSSQAAVSWLYYANRLYELPLGVVSVAIAAVLVPQITASVRTGDAQIISDAQSRGLELAIALALPSAIAFAVLAGPIAGGLFERGAFGPNDTAMVAAALAAIAAGLPGHVLEKVFGAASFAHEDTRTPMLTALCGLAAAAVGALLLFPHFGHFGIAAAIALSGWVGATLLGAILGRRGWLRIDRLAAGRLIRIVAAALAMGGFILLCRALAPAAGVAGPSYLRLIDLVLLVAAGLSAYIAALHILGVVRVLEVIGSVRNRLRRR